jgi:IclR family transcriptional regulator, pca regulon regulatory protein
MRKNESQAKPRVAAAKAADSSPRRAAPTPPEAVIRKAPREHVAALGKGLEVLTCFSRAQPRLTVSEAARLTGTTPASARRALLTLHELGYLAYDGKRFWLLPRVLLLANAYLASRPAPNITQPLLDALADRTRESASLATLLDDQVIITARSTARQSLTVGLRVGSRLPAYCSATGRVLLASLPAREAQRRVQRMTLLPLTPRTATDAREVLAHVEACRAQGYALCDGELELDVRSMAVPVFNHQGQTIGALSIAVRADRMPASELRRNYLPALRRAQAQLRERLFED